MAIFPVFFVISSEKMANFCVKSLKRRESVINRISYLKIEVNHDSMKCQKLHSSVKFPWMSIHWPITTPNQENYLDNNYVNCNLLKLLFNPFRSFSRKSSQHWFVFNHDKNILFYFLIGIDCWNPAFDVTPANLIKGIITEVGVLKPPLDTEVNLILLKQWIHMLLMR